MYRFLIILVGCTLVITSSQVLFKGRNYNIFKLSKIKHRNSTSFWSSDNRATVEKLYAGGVPKDNGKDNHGDLEFVGTLSNGTLIDRQTIVNDDYEDDVVIRYNRTLPGYYVTDMKVLNFGRQRGYCHSANIWHRAGKVDAEIIVLKGKAVRMFIEIYGWRV